MKGPCKSVHLNESLPQQELFLEKVPYMYGKLNNGIQLTREFSLALFTLKESLS